MKTNMNINLDIKMNVTLAGRKMTVALEWGCVSLESRRPLMGRAHPRLPSPGTLPPQGPHSRGLRLTLPASWQMRSSGLRCSSPLRWQTRAPREQRQAAAPVGREADSSPGRFEVKLSVLPTILCCLPRHPRLWLWWWGLKPT